MKIRSGFVSNSSSTSFMISRPKGKKKLKVRVEQTWSPDKVISTMEELTNYFDDKGDFDRDDPSQSEDYVYEDWLKAKAEIDAGRDLMIFEFHNPEAEIALYCDSVDEMQFPKDTNIIIRGHE